MKINRLKLNILLISIFILLCGGVVVSHAEHIHRDVDLKWNWDSEYHYYLCSCGQVFDKGKHYGGTATCTTKATCTECYKKYGDVDLTNHTGSTYVKDAKEPTCSEPGYSGDIYCSACNTIEEYGVEIPATGDHVDADGKYEYDGEKHYHTCSCGAIFDEDYHTGGKATCASGALCEVCGGAYGETNKRNHSGNIELKNRKIATSEEDGFTGDKYCADCGVLLEAGKKVIAPQILSGKDSIFNRQKAKDLTFKSSSDFSEFSYVAIDGTTLSDEFYTVMPGSTIVTLKSSYIETLDNGKHKIEICSQKGIGSCNFYVSDDGNAEIEKETSVPKATEDPDFNPTNVPDGDDTGCSGTIQGDVILMLFLVLLLLLRKKLNHS